MNTVYVFDLDGVITDPRTSTVDDEVVMQIRQLLETGLVAVNTGRSFAWVEQQFVAQLGGDDSVVSRLICVCEKGGESATWQSGCWVLKSSEFALDTAVYEQARAVFEQHRTDFTTMFWDETKRTMATIEKYPSADLSQFHIEQRQFVDALRHALTGADVRIDSTTIAIDIESIQAGKHAGAAVIRDWVERQKIGHIDHYVSFGDSVGDYEMARYFAEHAQSRFIYVGTEPNRIEQDDRVELVHTEDRFADGTREYLSRI